MNPTIYSHGLSYETFMCRAFCCRQNYDTGMHAGHYHAIYWSEHGFIKPKKTPQKQTAKVKTYLMKAINQFLRRQLDATEKAGLSNLKSQLKFVTTEADLFLIIDEGLLITSHFRIYNPS